MRNKANNASLLMFLIGLGSLTKIFFLGCISISELVIFVCAPFVLLANMREMRNGGFYTFIWFLSFITVGMLVASLYHHTPYVYVVKYLAVIYSLFAHYVAFCRIVRDDLLSIRWYFLGVAISGIITVFAFNPQVAMVGSSV